MKIRVPRANRAGPGAWDADQRQDRQTAGQTDRRKPPGPGAEAPWRGAGAVGGQDLGIFPPKPPHAVTVTLPVTRVPSPRPRRLLVAAPWDGDGQGDVYKCRVGPPNATCDKANLGTAASRGG